MVRQSTLINVWKPFFDVLPMLLLRNGYTGFILAKLWCNSSCHSALDRSPFEVLYGYKPNDFGIVSNGCSYYSVVELLASGQILDAGIDTTTFSSSPTTQPNITTVSAG